MFTPHLICLELEPGVQFLGQDTRQKQETLPSKRWTSSKWRQLRSHSRSISHRCWPYRNLVKLTKSLRSSISLSPNPTIILLPNTFQVASISTSLCLKTKISSARRKQEQSGSTSSSALSHSTKWIYITETLNCRM